MISLSHLNRLCSLLTNYEQSKQKKEASETLKCLLNYTDIQEKKPKRKASNNILNKITQSLKSLNKDDESLINDKKLSITQILQIKPTEFFEEILQKEVPFRTYVSKEKLAEIITYVSCCYFALAT